MGYVAHFKNARLIEVATGSSMTHDMFLIKCRAFGARFSFSTPYPGLTAGPIYYRPFGPGPRSERRGGRCKAARRRRCRCTSLRSANAADAPAPPEPEGRMGVAGRSPRCSSSTMCIGIASSSRLELAPQAPCARPLLILGRAPRLCTNARAALHSMKGEAQPWTMQIHCGTGGA